MVVSSKPFLIFDFDGTLANTFAFGVEIFNEVAPAYGLTEISVARVQQLRKLTTQEILDELHISRVMAIKMGAQIRKILHSRMEQVEPIDGAREAILNLHREGFRLGILSSNSVGNIRAFLEKTEMLECFSFIEAGVSLFGKSTRIANVLRKKSLSPSEVIYVGDETRDMEAARKNNVSSLAVCWGANGREALEGEAPEFCIDDPVDLLGCAREFASRE
ncbi:HAD-IA family hydrolase [Verrucomicrobiales bacterium BCK34]|nr:HAD-IA family hydrolase [Verrucomicrobiales bacterium BCK34]